MDPASPGPLFTQAQCFRVLRIAHCGCVTRLPGMHVIPLHSTCWKSQATVWYTEYVIWENATNSKLSAQERLSQMLFCALLQKGKQRHGWGSQHHRQDRGGSPEYVHNWLGSSEGLSAGKWRAVPLYSCKWHAMLYFSCDVLWSGNFFETEVSCSFSVPQLLMEMHSLCLLVPYGLSSSCFKHHRGIADSKML